MAEEKKHARTHARTHAHTHTHTHTHRGNETELERWERDRDEGKVME